MSLDFILNKKPLPEVPEIEVKKPNINLNKRLTNGERTLNKKATLFFRSEYAKRNAYLTSPEKFKNARSLYNSFFESIRKNNDICYHIWPQKIIDQLKNKDIFKKEIHTFSQGSMPTFRNDANTTITLNKEELSTFKKLEEASKFFVEKYCLVESDLFNETNISETIINWYSFKQRERESMIGAIFPSPNSCLFKRQTEVVKELNSEDTHAIKIEIDISSPTFSFEVAFKQICDILQKHKPLIIFETDLAENNNEIVNYQTLQNISFIKNFQKLCEGTKSERVRANSIVTRLEGLWLWDKKMNIDTYNRMYPLDQKKYRLKNVYDQFDSWKDTYIKKRKIESINYENALNQTEKEIKEFDIYKLFSALASAQL